MWESLGGIMVNGALRRSLEYSMYSLGFLAFGLDLDVTSGLPLQNPLGDLQSSP